MCGICGLATAAPRGDVDVDLLARMCAELVHRGPDGEGRHRSPGIGLGVRRLAVMDPTGGQQPISSEERRAT